jgi:hypothetical protein
MSPEASRFDLLARDIRDLFFLEKDPSDFSEDKKKMRCVADRGGRGRE